MKKRAQSPLRCPPEEIAIKSIFLGPQSENEKWFKGQINELLNEYFNWRKSRFPQDGHAISPSDKKNKLYVAQQKKTQNALKKLFIQIEKETPKFTPRYIGHMVSETSLASWLGHFLMLLHNPNNALRDVAKRSLQIEKEAIADLLKMCGFQTQSYGHFTSGGTLANLEATWRARFRCDHFLALSLYLLKKGKIQRNDFYKSMHMGWKQFNAWMKSESIHEEDLKQYSFVASNPWILSEAFESITGNKFRGPVVIVPGNKHYSWQKAVTLLGLGEEAFWSTKLDENGRLDANDLKKLIEKAVSQERPILMIVSVAGTTELGEWDPIDEVNELLESYKQKNIHIWHHVDAAYGGFYRCLLHQKSSQKLFENSTLKSIEALSNVDSITLDPHKLGYVPYACGTILVKDPQNNRVTSFAAAYIQQSNTNEKALWTTTLEGSRAATGAAATWMTSKSIGFSPNGLGRILKKGIEAKNIFIQELSESNFIQIIEPSTLNIVCLHLAQKGQSLKESNQITLKVYEDIHKGPHFGVSKTILHKKFYNDFIHKNTSRWNAEQDSDELCLLRLVLMNPFILSKELKNKLIDDFKKYLNTLYKKHLK